MNTYSVRYIHGPQDTLRASHQQTVRAATLDEALRAKSPWPIERSMDGTCGWAKNPGTSLYHVEAWEGTLIA